MSKLLGTNTNVNNLVATGTGTFTELIVSGSFTGTITQANTATRAYTLPDKDGTFAMLSDIVAGGGVTLDTTQTITGLKSFQQGDNASLSAECITAVADRDFSAANAWTGTGWSIVSGAFAHTAGANAATLPNTSLNITPTSGVVYVIAMKIITTTLGTVTVSFGGASLGIVAGQWVGTVNVNKYVVATGSGALTVTPDATWVGSIDDISIKILTRSSYPSMRLYTTSGTSAAEIRNYSNLNLGIGNASHRSNVSGTHNYALGYYAQAGLINGVANVAIGTENQEFLTSGTHNIAIGYFTQNSITSSSYNIGIGGYSQRYLTTGFNNVALGFQAQQALTVGWNNMALGTSAQMAITSGTANVAIGKSSQTALTTGSQNMGIGGNTLLKVTTGSYNVAIGNNSCYNMVTTNNNTGIGTDTLFNATASDNTAIGYGSLVDLTTGGYNTALGSLSGDGTTNATITYCSFFGYNARSTTDGITNSTAIGNGATVTASNQIQLGNTSVTAILTSGNLTLGTTTAGSASPQKIIRVNGGANADLAPVVTLFRTGNSEGGMAIVASKLKLFQGGGLGGYTDALITAANGLTVDMSGNIAATGTITGTVITGTNGVYSGTLSCYGLTVTGATWPSITFTATGTADSRILFRAGNDLRWRFDGTNDGNIWHSGTFNPSSKANTDQIMYIGTTAVAINRASAALNLTLGGTLAASGNVTITSQPTFDALSLISGGALNLGSVSLPQYSGKYIPMIISNALPFGHGSQCAIGHFTNDDITSQCFIKLSYDSSSTTFKFDTLGTISLDTAGSTVLSLVAANTWNKAQSVAQVTLTAGATVSVDASLSNNFIVTANTASWVLSNPTNLVAGQTLNIIIKQDATGSRVISYSSLYKFPGSARPALSTAPNAIDILSCYYDGTILICNLMKGIA